MYGDLSLSADTYGVLSLSADIYGDLFHSFIVYKKKSAAEDCVTGAYYTQYRLQLSS